MKAWRSVSINLLIASSVRLARVNLDRAKVLRAQAYRTAPTLAAQALEHALLALGHAEAIHIPRNAQHQLDTITRKLPAANPFREKAARIAWLEGYSTAYRYPKTLGLLPAEPNQGDFDAALEQLETLVAALAAYFGVILDPTSKQPAQRSDPPRAVD